MPRFFPLGVLSVCLLAAGPSVASDRGKLVWTYPCAFQYEDGTSYAKPPDALECDYMRTKLDHAAQQFNAKPTLESQLRFFADMVPAADAHIAVFEKTRDAILARTDPNSLPALTPDADRMRMLLEFKQDLVNSAQQACEPFLWQRFFEQSYLDDKSDGSYPDSWKPCMGAFEDRLTALDAAIAGGTPPILRDEDEKARAQLTPMPGAGAALNGTAAALRSSQDPAEELNGLYDGSGTSPAASVVRPAASSTGRGAPAATLRPTPQPTAPPPPPPAPEDVRQIASRNYFMRGYDAGMQRIMDDAQIRLGHWTGQSQTVGNPYKLAAWAVEQEGPSCDIGAVAEVLQSRGQSVAVKALAEEASAMGIYAEETLRDGSRVGGMHDGDLDKLLIKHGVEARYQPKATASELEADIRGSGLAIVAVNSRSFWNDPDTAAAVGHVVLVTGLEQSSNGAVLGYYVNDPGTGEGARFISKQDFLRAWAIKGNPLVSIP